MNFQIPSFNFIKNHISLHCETSVEYFKNRIMKAFIFLVVLLFLKTFAIGSDNTGGNYNILENNGADFYFIVSEDSGEQNPETSGENLIINSDSRIDTLIQIHKEENQRKAGIDGYRVQIFQGNKESAYQAKAKFLILHEDLKVYILFQSPDFRVRVGDFRTRSEALKVKHMIENQFSSTFVVEDEINLPELPE